MDGSKSVPPASDMKTTVDLEDIASSRGNKNPTNWWGRQNAAPQKFDRKPSEAAFWTVFLNVHKCVADVTSAWL